ncbi:hypothetical protein FisN_30Hu071 [Fistulifera solaris]|uniref:MYND-type domain-containing protein n=1 Tax=Fistulifera solaris TaxID=1519565 RepID=A0A1Z5K6I8_FISSO|nr:hypothetical protein FisN_30Hu071 [Fistulifera solaris]|eukprot:GAX21870.1 hypothetical protein FisN_30Hu071 [Fistulifera solaris]
MYEGKDPLLQDEPSCYHCSVKPTTKLLRCSRCHVAWYCTPTCQKAHHKKHRFLCMEIDKYTKLVDDEGNRLCAALGANIFETEIGNFWGLLPATATYMDLTNALANWYSSLALECNVKEVWEKALYHQLEHLQLGVLDRMDARLRVPFFLLYMNRDDDAFTFIRYWVETKEVLETNPDAVFERHRNSKSGDWLYPRETDARYLDIFDQVPGDLIQEMELPFLVALFLIKLRIVASHDDATESMDIAFKTTGGQRIQEVQSAIAEMLVRQDVDAENQRRQIYWLLFLIHRRNPHMLPGLTNPAPYFNRPPPTDRIAGEPSEVSMCLLDCKVAFYRVPAAPEILKNILAAIESSAPTRPRIGC